MRIKKKSGWTFQTSESGGLGAGVVSLTSGTFYLNRPGQKAVTAFNYTSVGAGESLGIKLPGDHERVSFGGSVSKADWYSTGTLWILDNFEGNELEAEDMSGLCTFADVSFPIGSTTALFLGIQGWKSIAKEVGYSAWVRSNPVLWANSWWASKFIDLVNDSESNWLPFLTRANALLLFGGRAIGTSIGVSSGWGWVGGLKTTLQLQYDFDEDVTGRTTSTPKLVQVGDVKFDFDKSEITAAGAEELRQAGYKIRSAKGYIEVWVIVRGSTDSIGGEGYNQLLSERRAKAVKDWLISNSYVNASEVKPTGEGISDVYDNKTAVGRAKNRNVEIFVFPK